MPMKTGVVTAALTFILLLASNRTILSIDFIPDMDAAADILLTQRAKHGWLLTGHYNTTGVHHPGPFFLYIRLIGQWVSRGITGSIFGSQLTGVLAFSAFSAGLLAELLKELTEREGAKANEASYAALGAVTFLLCVLHRHIVSFWMPDIIVMPFLIFLVASMLASQGSVFGLLSATLYAAILIHGYIPMLLIVAPIWLYSILKRQNTENYRRPNGFPCAAWAWVVIIISLFVSPLVLDAIIEPPGNLLLILNKIKYLSIYSPLTLADSKYLWRYFLESITANLSTSVSLIVFSTVMTYRIRQAHGDLWLLALPLTVMPFFFAGLAFSQSHAPLSPYMFRFLEAPLLIPATLGILMTSMEIDVKQRKIFLCITASLLLSLSIVGRLTTTEFNNTALRSVSSAIAAENRPANMIQLTGQIKYRKNIPDVAHIGTSSPIAGLMLDLDNLGISSCFPDSRLAYLLTPERICSNQYRIANKYFIETLPACDVNKNDPPPKQVGSGLSFESGKWRNCFHIRAYRD